MENKAVEDHSGIKVYDIQYDGLYGKSVMAYLVAPVGEGPFPAILYAHWLGSSKSDRREFLDEAIEMAQKGIASLLPESVFHGRRSPRICEGSPSCYPADGPPSRA